MDYRADILRAFGILTVLFVICLDIRPAKASGGLLLFTANGSPYVDAVVYESFSSPSAHLSYVTVKGGGRTQIQSRGIIANIPYPVALEVSYEDADSMISQTDAYAIRYPQYAKLLRSVGGLWKHKAEATRLAQSLMPPAVSAPASPPQSGKVGAISGTDTAIPLILLNSGPEFKSAKITRIEGDQASVSHTDGVTKIALSDISNLPDFPADVRSVVEKGQAGLLAQKRADEDRLAAERTERERLAKNETDRLAAEKVEQERLATIEANRLAAEKAERERWATIEADRLAAERAERERLAKNETDRLVAERVERERLAADAKAIERFHEAADQGIAGAQYRLGTMYAEGRGVAKDYAKAAEWYQKAVDQGNASAQLSLGCMYEAGRGVTKDDAKAAELYRKAANQGIAIAQDFLRDIQNRKKTPLQQQRYLTSSTTLQQQGDLTSETTLQQQGCLTSAITQNTEKWLENEWVRFFGSLAFQLVCQKVQEKFATAQPPAIAPARGVYNNGSDQPTQILHASGGGSQIDNSRSRYGTPLLPRQPGSGSIAGAYVTHAGAQTPVVVPVQCTGTATTSQFGNGYITRPSSGQTYTTSQFGTGANTRNNNGNTWITSLFGNGAITRGPGGQTVSTSQFGTGTITRDNNGNTWITSLFGNGAITRGPGGQTVTTSQFGNGYINRDSSGSTTTTSKFGNGVITRSDAGASAVTTTFGTGFITRGSSTTTPVNNPASSNVLVLPARK